MAKPLNGALTGIGGVFALVVTLAAVDPRVRDQLSALVSGRGATGEIVTAGQRVHDIALTVVQAVRDQSIEHAPLTIFALGALVIVLFMTRT